MITINGNNSLIQFGQDISSQIDNIQGKDVVITKELLKKTYPMTLQIKIKNTGAAKDYDNLNLGIRYHFCQHLHLEKTAEEYNAFTQKDNYQNDERIFFVIDEK